jgi:predicted membrane protein
MWAIFGSRKEKLPSDWDSVNVRAVLGSADLDASASPPESEHSVRALAIFGSVKVVVPRGSRVHTSGSAIMGSREVKVDPGDGPEFHVNATSLFGSVDVVEVGEKKS